MSGESGVRFSVGEEVDWGEVTLEDREEVLGCDLGMMDMDQWERLYIKESRVGANGKGARGGREAREKTDCSQQLSSVSL
jgi:hypothetical protein